jgi:seryl-tRNA synthetase
MGLDDLPHQFAAFVNSARTIFDREIEKSKKVVAALSAEKASAQSALAELQAQRKSAEKQLNAVHADLARSSELAGVGHDMEKARTELEKVKAETAKADKTLEARLKQITEADARLVVLGNEAQRLVAIRVEGEAVMANLRMKLQQVQIGVQP